MEATSDGWEAVLERLDGAAKLTGLDDDVHRLLRLPRRVREVSVPVRMDDGRVGLSQAGGSTTTPHGDRPGITWPGFAQ
jgi:glutamate dehydrogenase/leucine dehydrogenase